MAIWNRKYDAEYNKTRTDDPPNKIHSRFSSFFSVNSELKGGLASPAVSFRS